MPRNELRSLHLPIAEELGKRAGIRPRVRPNECAPYAIAGKIPKLVFSPRNATEASKTIATLAGEAASIIVRGTGTKQFCPPAPVDVDAVLDTTRCAGVIEYAPADLTVSVAGGTPFVQLQESLRTNRQFFPCDPPFAADATIGGVLSSRSAGALRQLYGAPRDSVLGMRVCLSDGSIAFTGSKVVKSVAGYDIPKLFVGARGTLGFIAEVTLKVAPLPLDQRGIVAWFADPDRACSAAASLASSPLFPMATTLHDPSACHRIRALAGTSPERRWTLVVRCGGSRAAVSASVDAVASMCREQGAKELEVLDADRLNFAWSDIAELAGGAAYPQLRYLVCKISCLPADAAAACKALLQRLPQSELTAHPHAGAIYAHVDVARCDDELALSLRELERRCEAQHWSLEYPGAPPPLGAWLRQPLPASSPVLLMRRVKAALDPTGTFDPGRYVAGI